MVQGENSLTSIVSSNQSPSSHPFSPSIISPPTNRSIKNTLDFPWKKGRKKNKEKK